MNGDARIFIGDLARALVSAGSQSGENWEEIASLLGFTRSASPTATLPDATAPTNPAERSKASPAVQRQAAPLPEPIVSEIGEILEFDFDHNTAPPIPLPQSVSALSERRRMDRLMFRPLLDPLWQRGILIEAVGRQLPEGDISVLAAVEAIARGEPLAEVPREKVQSVSKGCQLLIDTGSGMRPFSRDARELIVAVRSAVGVEHTRVLTFLDCPTKGVLNESYDDEPYRPPDNGALVLAVSDLCVGGPGSAIRPNPRDWLKVAQTVRDAGSLLVVLNPYPRESWPAELAARMPILYWDRTTRAADVRRVRRRAR